jgi:CHASE2 domain-containing sensor protein
VTALCVAVLLYVWPIVSGSEIYWPNYRRGIPFVAVFAVALVPLLVPRRLLRPELVPIVAALGRLAFLVVALLLFLEVWWLLMHPLY